MKGYGVFSFDKNISKKIDKNIRKNLNSKNSQKFLDHAKQSATDALKTTPKIAIQKTTEETGDLTGNKNSDKITKVSTISPQNSSVTVTNKTKNIGLEREIPKERYTFPEKRLQVIHV